MRVVAIMVITLYFIVIGYALTHELKQLE